MSSLLLSSESSATAGSSTVTRMLVRSSTAPPSLAVRVFLNPTPTPFIGGSARIDGSPERIGISTCSVRLGVTSSLFVTLNQTVGSRFGSRTMSEGKVPVADATPLVKSNGTRTKRGLVGRRSITAMPLMASASTRSRKSCPPCNGVMDHERTGGSSPLTITAVMRKNARMRKIMSIEEL